MLMGSEQVLTEKERNFVRNALLEYSNKTDCFANTWSRDPQYGAHGHHGAYQVFLVHVWGQVGLLPSRVSDWL